MPPPDRPPIRFEPLGNHDGISFSCGVAELDRYLHTQASQDAKKRVAAPFVMITPDSRILGYYTLSAYGLRMSEPPSEMAKKLPKYPLLPATLLGRLAVCHAHGGQKLGSLLLMDALHRSWKNTNEIASIGVVAEATDDQAREFYLHHEFVPFSEHTTKLIIAMKTIESAFRKL